MRRPRGYEGVGHETIGSDVLAVRHAVGELAGSAEGAERLLGAVANQRLEHVEPDGWYPIAWLLEMMETVDERVGRFAVIKLGRAVFRISHRDRIAAVAACGRDIVYGIDGMYRHANRGGGIGGWTVLEFDANRALLEKTTPHHCLMEEGILNEALRAVGSPAVISQPQCFRDGADACHFEILPAMQSAIWELGT